MAIPKISKCISIILFIAVSFFSTALFVESSSASNLLLKLEQAGAEYVGTETCTTCHEDAGKEFQLSTHARITNDEMDGVAQGCEMCHGPGSLHVDEGGGMNTAEKTLIINPKESPEGCFNCHMEKKAEFRLPYKHPVLEGKMTCFDCHENLHGPDANPWTAVSMEGTNGTCFKCHKDQQGPFIFEHPALREGCSSCHKVHGSINKKMLISRQANLCLKCHQQSDHPDIGRSHSQNRIVRGTCWVSGCHYDVHGSNFYDHFRD